MAAAAETTMSAAAGTSMSAAAGTSMSAGIGMNGVQGRTQSNTKNKPDRWPAPNDLSPTI
jgi:hypothetical protein